MTIENSTEKDIPKIFRLYRLATEFQKQKFPENQWPDFFQAVSLSQPCAEAGHGRTEFSNIHPQLCTRFSPTNINSDFRRLAITLNLKGLFCCKHHYPIFRFFAISFSGFPVVKNIYGLNLFWIKFFDAFS